MTLCGAGLASVLRSLGRSRPCRSSINGETAPQEREKRKEQAQEAKFVQGTSEVCGSSQKHVLSATGTLLLRPLLVLPKKHTRVSPKILVIFYNHEMYSEFLDFLINFC